MALLLERGYSACEIDFEGRFWMDYAFAESFGALAAAHDVALSLPDPAKAKQISRWHFELRQLPDGLSLRQISDQSTEVDGHLLQKGAEAPVRSGTVVKVGRVMTLVFGTQTADHGGPSDATSFA